jgi:hypothetical protein
MGRGNEDWSNGKIYRIISNNPEISVVYYGSTVQKLCKRMASHRGHYKAWCAGKANNYSIFPYFKQYGIEQFHIELVEDFPCDNEQQLLTQENVYIRENDCCNKQSAFSTPEEKKQQKKQYRQANRDTILLKQKQHYQDNKEQFSIKKKQHYKDNKEQISINGKEIITCICGCQISRGGLSSHLKTKKHISLVQNLK